MRLIDHMKVVRFVACGFWMLLVDHKLYCYFIPCDASSLVLQDWYVPVISHTS